MKTWTKNILMFGLLSLGISASAQDYELAPHTEDAEIVCQMDDFLATKLYVDQDEDLNKPTGKNSTKVIERATQHVFGHDLLLKVQVVKVEYPTCAGCEDLQVIYYRSQSTPDILNKLEVSSTQAKLTVGVDKKGRPTRYSVVSQGSCEANEVY